MNHHLSLARIPLLREAVFRRDPLGFLSALAERRGDFAEFALGGRRFILVNSQELAHSLLVTNQHKFHKGPGLQRAKRLLGEGLLTSEGEYHRRQRRLIQPAFTRQRVAEYAGAVTRCALARQSRWRDGEELDISREMQRVALAVLGDTILGEDVRREAEEIGDAVDEIIRMSVPASGPRSVWKASMIRLGLSENRFPRLRGRVDAAVARIIARRRAAGGGPDLLSTLLRLRDEEGALTDEQVRDEVMTLVHAGHETTAGTLTWLWVLLARNPDAERRLHEELDEALPRGRAPEVGDLPRLVYTNAAVTETLRLYPAAWVISRYAIEDAELEGRRVTRGSVVLVSPYLMQRKPESYERPSEFCPERWMGGAEAQPFMPFGMGPRRCVGENFALMESVLITAVLARRWRFRLAPNTRVELDPRITLRPKRGVRVVLRGRETDDAG